MSLPRVRKRGEGGKTIVKTMRCLLRPGGIGFLNGPCRGFSRLAWRSRKTDVSRFEKFHPRRKEKRSPRAERYFSANGSQKARLFPVAGGCGLCTLRKRSKASKGYTFGTWARVPLRDVSLFRQNWITLLSFVPRTGRSISLTNEIPDHRYDRDVGF